MPNDLKWYETYAKENNIELTPHAEKVIKMVDKCEGYCPCKVSLRGKIESILCPCEEHKTEIETDGYCHCRLFKSKTD